jgi:histidyl-tRNA synthetase
LKDKPKPQQQFKAADDNKIPWAIVIGEDELAQGKVKIKRMGLPEGDPEKEGVLVDLTNLVTEMQQRLSLS